MIRAVDPTQLLPGAGQAATTLLPAVDAPARAAGAQPEAIADEALMLRYRDGDASAFDLLYERHRAGLYRFILRQCSNRGEVDEIFQDVWMNLINARTRYQPSAKFRTFLFQIARNRVIDIARRAPGAHLLSIDEEQACGATLAEQLPASAALEPQAIAERRTVSRELKDAIAALPFVQREALLLHEDGGLSLDEIAVLTGAGRETVKSRLRYALGRLRLHLGVAGREGA